MKRCLLFPFLTRQLYLSYFEQEYEKRSEKTGLSEETTFLPLIMNEINTWASSV